MAGSGGSRGGRPHPFPLLNAVATKPFYLLHLIAFFSYFAVRDPSSSPRLIRREIQAVLSFLVLMAVKIVREETWEGFIADALLYAKGLLLVVLLTFDYRLTLFYFLGFLVMYVATRQPPYYGTGDAKRLTPLQLECLLISVTGSRFWLVEFRSSRSSACIRASRIFPELSVIHGNKNFSFGIVDLEHFSNCSEKFGIPTHAHLPVYILFDKATAIARFPPSFHGRSVPTISKRLLCQYFELDKRLVEYLSN